MTHLVVTRRDEEDATLVSGTLPYTHHQDREVLAQAVRAHFAEVQLSEEGWAPLVKEMQACLSSHNLSLVESGSILNKPYEGRNRTFLPFTAVQANAAEDREGVGLLFFDSISGEVQGLTFWGIHATTEEELGALGRSMALIERLPRMEQSLIEACFYAVLNNGNSDEDDSNCHGRELLPEDFSSIAVQSDPLGLSRTVALFRSKGILLDEPDICNSVQEWLTRPCGQDEAAFQFADLTLVLRTEQPVFQKMIAALQTSIEELLRGEDETADSSSVHSTFSRKLKQIEDAISLMRSIQDCRGPIVLREICRVSDSLKGVTNLVLNELWGMESMATLNAHVFRSSSRENVVAAACLEQIAGWCSLFRTHLMQKLANHPGSHSPSCAPGLRAA